MKIKQDLIITKSNVLIQYYHSDFTEIESNLFDFIIGLYQLTINSINDEINQIRENSSIKVEIRENNTPSVKFYMKSYFQYTSHSSSIGGSEFTIFSKSLESLSNKKLYFVNPCDSIYSINKKELTIIDSFKIDDQKNVDIILHADIIPFISNFSDNEKVTIYKYSNKIQLHSKYSKKLYEVLKSFESSNRVYLSGKHLQFDIEKFKKLLNIPLSYKAANVKTRILEKSKIEFNSTDIIFEYSFAKKRHKISEIIFQIYKKKSTHNYKNQICNPLFEDIIIENMNGEKFEYFVSKLLYENGFNHVEVTKYSHDFGVDVIAFKDEIKYAIQCKRYNSNVGIKAVQEIIGSKIMNNCHVGVVLTNSKFTNSAVKLAKANNVLLWDLDKLNKMMQKYKK